MDMAVIQRRHNPVDSICRKLQTIQRRGQEADSPFQIPRFQSRSYDSPQPGLRGNLEAILKRRAVRREGESEGSPGMLTPTGSPRPRRPASSTSSSSSFVAAAAASPANATYTISSTLAEQREAGPKSQRAWSQTCSTPATQSGDRFFSFSQYATYSRPDGRAGGTGDPRASPAHSMHGCYNLNFCTSDASSLLDCDPDYPALVVKRLSMGDGGQVPSEQKKDTMAEVSLICEEDLLDTIFHACDTQRRGKVYVSHIVDYLRHTTSRGSEDSGLEELCNMLDPDRKDVSIDLVTYHAIMKEWIQDCRNQGDDTPEDLLQESVRRRDSGKRSALMNLTSGSLEAFGGEASRGDLETSDLVYCVADLQFNNQKLHDEVRKLKLAMETMEDLNQKLMEENEELKTQAKIAQQLAQKEKLLKEEVEEMKVTLSTTEESRTLAKAQIKQMERENHSLITKISSLQEENIKITMEIDELQKKMIELCDLNADLQVQVHSFDGVLLEREACVQEKNRQIEELKSVIEEYSSVTEVLRAEKTKLESQMQMMQPDMSAAGVSLSVAYRLNQTSSGSLQAELALAQEGSERLSSSLCFASPLDETLDREVLLLLQGPTPEQMSVHFKNLVCKLNKDFKEDCSRVLSTLKQVMETQSGLDSSGDQTLQALRSELEQKRKDWSHSLQQLDQYTDSLEKEIIKMASNMRRSRTEILHLSVRVQEQENQRQQLHEELEQLRTPLPEGREASSQTVDHHQQQLEEESDGPSLGWEEEDCIMQQLSKEEEEQPNSRRGEEERRFSPCEEKELRDCSAEGEDGVVCEAKCEKEVLRGSAKETEERKVLDYEEQELRNSNGEGEDMKDSRGQEEEEEEVVTPGDSRGEDAEEELCGSCPPSQETPPCPGVEREELESTDTPDGDLRGYSEPQGQGGRLPGSTGPQDSRPHAVPRVPEVPPYSHTQLVDALNLDPLQPQPSLQESPPARTSFQDLILSPVDASSELDLTLTPRHTSFGQDLTLTPGLSLLKQDLAFFTEHIIPQQGEEMVPPTGRTCPLPACTQGEGGGGAAGAGGGSSEDSTASNMTDTKVTSLDQLSASAVPQDSGSLRPGPGPGQAAQEAGQVSPVEDRMAGADGQAGGEDGCRPATGGSPHTADGWALTPADPSDAAKEDGALEAALADDGLSPGLESQTSRGPRRDSFTLRSKFKRELELSGSMEAIEEHTTQEDLSQVSEKEDDTPLNSEDAGSDSTKDDKNSLSPSDKEIETEFHRLSLGFKCDMFTLEKRLRLEERSRDLAEDNLKREASSCQDLLKMLLPLCEDDNRSMEIIHRLQKNLDILTQSMARVSSRSEMLGAIHQESRVSRAVEVMIQHVENLRRMYTKEHSELMELREMLMQSERSFGANPDRDDFRNKKTSGSQYYKPSSRRVSIAVIPRSSGGAVHFDMPKSHEAETEADRLARRSSWHHSCVPPRHHRKAAGNSSLRPSLKRFISSCTWAETDEPSLMKGCDETDSAPEEEKTEQVRERRKSSLTELGSKLTSLILPSKIPVQTVSRQQDSRPPVPKSSRGWWVSVVLVVLLAALLALLASLAFQPTVDAAPVGTGDSWVTIQQLLWPYTSLRHNGQPPV
ncbi:hypothetical protein MATL_G00249330 [Megalops atlanticus]|uniref:Lymphoid-restricted membrane protein n=1 Tax=Megalops atlanticus TaxID=7932 RepID=A0A9D3PDQ6_MEGAT|nr:hypothetical protein MATL_G00249330 [Megalops atlanticus]